MLLDRIFGKEVDQGLIPEDLEIYLTHSKLFSHVFIKAIETKFSLKDDPCMNSLLHLLYHSMI
jgi:hypothetical protein